MKTETLLVALIALLVVFAGVQAFQIATISQAVAKGVSVSGNSVQGVSGAGSVQKSSALAQLPTQVGGCG